MHVTLVAISAVLWVGAPAAARAGHARAIGEPALPSLRSGQVRLEFMPGPHGGFGVCLKCPGRTAAAQTEPLEIELVDRGGAARWLHAAYTAADRPAPGVVRCSGAIAPTSGTEFTFKDTYRSLRSAGAFELRREVTVRSASADDIAFSSQFALGCAAPRTLIEGDTFVPGVWYGQNTHVPATALAARMDDRQYLVREDRLPLPLVMMRDRGTGMTVALARSGGTPSTMVHDDGLERIVDERLQYGALGVDASSGVALAYRFPGSEGERTYVFGGSSKAGRWALRSHPVRPGVPHRYTLVLQAGRTPSYPDAQRGAWRLVYDRHRPKYRRSDLRAVYGSGIEVLSEYCRRYHGAISMPFQVSVPRGAVIDTSSQMGFVGQALPAAALLLRRSPVRADASAAARAEELVDFWAANSMLESGLPRTWYDIGRDGQVTWRKCPTYLRVASDGMRGALRAWSALRRLGKDRPQWLAFCRRFGDWLVVHQGVDGSFVRAARHDGTVAEPATSNTSHAIPFLVDLYLVTRDARYRRAALRAGEFCVRGPHPDTAYVGGTPDNPNAIDKEAGVLAFAAFLSLHDLDGETRWLRAAARAADYSETWVYCRHVPMPEGDPEVLIPPGRTTIGLSLISTGHSGADTFMSAAPFLYYRLYLHTRDPHYLDVARLLLHSTKQLLNTDGSLGYAHRGLQTEALTLAPPRGHGVKGWLPWLTVAHLEPLADLNDAFETMDADAIEKLPWAERVRRDAAYGRSHGLAVAP